MTSVKIDFLKWIENEDFSSLNSTQIKLLNLFINYFDDIYPLGTAAGKRAKKISSIIENEHSKLPETKPRGLLQTKISTNSFVKLTQFEVGPFRGFTQKEVFNFNSQYTFLYGPNGSGKSSFCEGLEFALLGDIQEAKAKRISIKNYINNSTINASVEPKVFIGEKNNKNEISPDVNKFRFCFIEKNRIDGFARITASSPSEQKDRIAILFGLEEFSNFVDGFSDNIEKYLSLEPKEAKAFESELIKLGERKEKLVELNKDQSSLKNSIDKTLIAINEDTVKNIADLKVFLIGEDSVSGIISDLQQKKAENIEENIPLDSFNRFIVLISDIRKKIKSIETKVNNLKNDSVQLNFHDLYKSIKKIDNQMFNICPSCLTPLEKTVVNPFTYADEKLEQLKELSNLQCEIPSEARVLVKKINNLRSQITKINDDIKRVKIENSNIKNLSEVEYSTIDSIELWTNQTLSHLDLIEPDSEKIRIIENEFNNFNEALAVRRKEKNLIDSEIKRYRDFENQRNIYLVKYKQLKEDIDKNEQEIEKFNKENSKKIEIVDNEKKSIEVYKQFGDSYKKLVSSLKQFRNELPIKISKNLNEKALEYYNVINSHDPDFEKIEKLSLPATSGDIIEIKFRGSSIIDNALHVLSEGHIKILGLSILLAKIHDMKLSFIIFDDIVNAIDDDHRNGIANLLIQHDDFKNIQQIITCHGEQFINKLEHKLGVSRSSKEVTRYRFYPADTIESRRIKLSIGDTKHYIVQAEKFFIKDERKNAASKCRQALESLVDTLWKKMANKLNMNLTVQIRRPGSQPDLYSVVNSLKKELGKIDKDLPLFKYFEEITTKLFWDLLNKGTHEDDSLPEFERGDIKELISLVKSIEEEVLKLKLKPVSV